MTEPVSFKIAKLLKEKGFDEETLHFYTKSRSKMFGINEHNRYYNIVNTPKKLYTCGEHSVADVKNVYSAPTITDVVMWLYEKHGIWIVILPELLNGTEIRYYPSVFEQGVGEDIEEYYNSPTEAYEAAIKYCLAQKLKL